MSQPESPLSRRIEALAAQARDADGDRAGSPGLAPAVAALRFELGAVRADFASLRAEIGAVRSDLDAVGGRMAGGLSSTRTETAAVSRRMEELTGRLEALGTRVDDVRTALPALTRELHDGLDALPARAGERLADIVRDLADGLGGRIEEATADVRRAVGAGLEEVTARAQASEGTLAEARAVLEAHAAALEDALDVAADRLESVSRDGAHAAHEALRTLGDRADAATSRIEEVLAGLAGATAERSDGLRGDLLGAQEHTRSVVERVEGSLGSLHEALWRATDELGGRLERALGESTGGLHGAVEAQSSRLAELAAAVAEDGGFVRAAVDALEHRLEEVRSTLSAAVAAGREETAQDTGRLASRVDEVVGAARASIEGEVSSLRIDLADALEEVRDRVAGQIEAAGTSVRAALTETRTEVAARTAELRGAVLDRLDSGAASTASRLGDLLTGSTVTAGAVAALTERLGALEQAVGVSDRTVAGMRAEWGQRSTELIADARAAAEASTEQVRAEVTRQLATVAAELANAVDAVSTAREGLDADTTRLASAGEALLGYLERRDLLLEQERDRMLRELLEEFAAGLSGRERRTVAGKVGEALERRRDVRDAERWRSAQPGSPAARTGTTGPGGSDPVAVEAGHETALEEAEHVAGALPRARRRSPRVTEMPTVPSPDAALDAAVSPPSPPPSTGAGPSAPAEHKGKPGSRGRRGRDG